MNCVAPDLSFIVQYNWPSVKHLQEALMIAVSSLVNVCLSKDENDNANYIGNDVLKSEEGGEAAMRLVSNPETILPILVFLSGQENSRVTERIAEHACCSPELLTILAKHWNPEVRAAVAGNFNCPVAVLYALAKDEHPDVRYRLAEDPNIPDSILEQLSEDDNPYVASRAGKTLRKLLQGIVVEGHFQQFIEDQPKTVGLEGS